VDGGCGADNHKGRDKPLRINGLQFHTVFTNVKTSKMVYLQLNVKRKLNKPVPKPILPQIQTLVNPFVKIFICRLCFYASTGGFIIWKGGTPMQFLEIISAIVEWLPGLLEIIGELLNIFGV